MVTSSTTSDEHRSLLRPSFIVSKYTSSWFYLLPFILLVLYLLTPSSPSLSLLYRKPIPLNADGLPLNNSLTFIAIGDWGRKGHHHQRDVAISMSKVITRLGGNLNFVVSTGDNFYENGVSSVNDKQWNRSYEHVYNERQFNGLQWWLILGNHDHLGNIKAQVAYGKTSSRWNMPHFYYDKVFEYESHGRKEKIHFVFLDTTPYVDDGYGKEARKKNGQKPDKQTAWFRHVMQKGKAEKVVIILHHQMYTMSIAGHLGTRKVRAAFEPIILEHRHRVLAVISGHEHLMEHLQPYGGYNQWKGLASRIASVNDVKKVRQGGRKNQVVDYFISGSGSQLDKLKRPKKAHESIWMDCCSVLPISTGVKEPRAVYGIREHGFFVFSITERRLYAKAFDGSANVIYKYEKPI